MNTTTITLSKITYKGEELLIIGFPYDFGTKEYVKNFDSVCWSQTLKSFYLPYSRPNTNALFQYLRNKKYYVDYSALKANRQRETDKTQPNKKIKINRAAKPDVIERITSFKKWMAQKRYSTNTITTYESMLLMFFGFHNSKSVGEITEKDLQDFNINYILANTFSYTYQNQAINALKLFYAHDGSNLSLSENFERPKKQHRLPEVLSIDEVKAILGSLSNLKHKTLLCFLYSCGLRIGETLNIQVRDLDLKRGFTHIRSGKGHKDRYVPIPKQMRVLLYKYIESYKPKLFLFEGQNGSKYSPVSARQILKRALGNVAINKTITLHTLRHSHATHLLENGTDIRYIQELLGHNSPKTTMIYTHVSTTSLDKIKNPFDEFDI